MSMGSAVGAPNEFRAPVCALSPALLAPSTRLRIFEACKLLLLLSLLLSLLSAIPAAAGDGCISSESGLLLLLLLLCCCSYCCDLCRLLLRHDGKLPMTSSSFKSAACVVLSCSIRLLPTCSTAAATPVVL
jgi:hypothetical protein